MPRLAATSRKVLLVWLRLFACGYLADSDQDDRAFKRVPFNLRARHFDAEASARTNVWSVGTTF